MRRVLVANRGEIAVRITRTARRMGLGVVAVYSDADAGAFHVREADAAIAIGPTEARPYLDGARIIAAAKEAGADAIHPGYGFLSENADFAEAVVAAGLVWVGPPPAAIRAMGSKAEAKALMERAGVPVVPGYHGELQDGQFLKRKAYEIGYPVLIKAVAGGGGKGMRRVDKALAFEDLLASAQREAAGAFGDARVLVEKFVERPRHVEVQVFADADGRTVSLAERDCSVQRRHQKVIEEAPAPGMTPELRAAMGEAAVKAAAAAGYVGAGTVEFIADGSNLSRFYFMEMNTRLQVEHPVTEAVMGIDLVEWQFRVAAGEPLPPVPDAPSGHAVEARLYAEDPAADFLPSSGRIAVLRWPAGVRVDAGVEAGDTVSPHYDPMIAKMIFHGRDRGEALAGLADALGRTVAIGPRTNLSFLRAVVTHPEFAAGRHDTSFIDRRLGELSGGTVGAQAIADAAAAILARRAGAAPARREFVDPFAVDDAFRMAGGADASVALDADGTEKAARVAWGPGGIRVTLDGHVGDPGSDRVVEAGDATYAVEAGRAVKVRLVDQLSRALADVEAPRRAAAPMHGRITAVFVVPGEHVAAGAKLFAIEAMKMEHTVKAAAAAVVTSVQHGPGDQVAEGTDVITLADPGEAAAAPQPAAAPEAAEAEAAPASSEPRGDGDGRTEAGLPAD